MVITQMVITQRRELPYSVLAGDAIALLLPVTAGGRRGRIGDQLLAGAKLQELKRLLRHRTGLGVTILGYRPKGARLGGISYTWTDSLELDRHGRIPITDDMSEPRSYLLEPRCLSVTTLHIAPRLTSCYVISHNTLSMVNVILPWMQDLMHGVSDITMVKDCLSWTTVLRCGHHINLDPLSPSVQLSTYPW